MHPRQEGKPSPAFLLNSVDRLGRQIDPAVLSIAIKIGPRTVPYAERLLGDPALAISLFEEAAASVSEAIDAKERAGRASVKDLAAYLFRTYIRMVGELRRKQTILEESLKQQAESQDLWRNAAKAEAALLLDEVMATYDRVTREIAFRRLEGFSWKEIGERYGISGHAAEARFSKALDHARKTLKIRSRRG
jgi:DNA-directed RNA polymerase specialized sigma24 family protein